MWKTKCVNILYVSDTVFKQKRTELMKQRSLKIRTKNPVVDAGMGPSIEVIFCLSESYKWLSNVILFISSQVFFVIVSHVKLQ